MSTREIESGRYTGTDGESYFLVLICIAIRLAMVKQPCRARVPERVWRLAARGLDAIQGSSGSFERLFGGEEYSNRDICQTLGWQPRDALENLMPAMMAELR